MPDIVEDNQHTTVYHNFIGVDPGVGGGLAYIEHTGIVETLAMPKTEAGVWNWINIRSACWRQHRVFACIELVGGYVGSYNREEGDDGSKSNPGSAMFTFGQSYGALRMALVAAGIPFEAVRPQAWQKALRISRNKDVGAESWKNQLRYEAQRLYPQLKVTKKTADALLIASYARMKWGNNRVSI